MLAGWVTAVLAHAFGPLGLDGMMAVAMPDNVGSRRVMEKAGMRYEGIASYYGVDGLNEIRSRTKLVGPPVVS